jgi:CcmD family protein
METLITTYAVAFVAIGGYTAWLVIARGRIARRLEQFEIEHGARPAGRTSIHSAA